MSLKNYNGERVAVYAGRKYFENNHVERPYQVNGDPNGYYVENRDETYVVWHVKTEAWVTLYDHDTGEWDTSTRVGSVGVNDYHGAPSITVDGDGYVHVIWGGWGQYSKGNMVHAISTNPYDISSWGINDPSVFEDDVTYPVLWSSGSSVYAGFRDGGAGTGRPFAYSKLIDNGSNWMGPTELIQADHSDMWIYCCTMARHGSDVHLVWREHRRDTSPRSYRRLFHAIFDTADDSLRAMDGTALSTPLGYTEAVNNCLVAEHTDNSFVEAFSGADVQVDGNGRPYIALHVDNGVNADPRVWKTYFVYWNGTGWSAMQEVTDVATWHAYPAINVESSTNVDIFTVIDNPDATGWQIPRYNWDGNSWSQAEIVLSDEVPYYGAAAHVAHANDELSVLLSEYDGSDNADHDRTTPLRGFAWGDYGLVSNTFRVKPKQ